MALVMETMTPVLYSIDKAHKDTDDTFTLELCPEKIHSKGVVAFKGGQFNMLYIYGVGEISISISGDPSDPERMVHTTRAVGSVTRAMRNLKRGDRVGVRGPFGTAWPVEKTQGKDV